MKSFLTDCAIALISVSVSDPFQVKIGAISPSHDNPRLHRVGIVSPRFGSGIGIGSV